MADGRSPRPVYGNLLGQYELLYEYRRGADRITLGNSGTRVNASNWVDFRSFCGGAVDYGHAHRNVGSLLPLA